MTTSFYRRNLGVPVKIQGLLTELENGLASSLQKNSSDKPESKASLSAINSIGDEYSFWALEAKGLSNKAAINRAAFFRDAWSGIKADFDRLRFVVSSLLLLFVSALTFDDLLETLEKLHDTIDDIWRQQEHTEYPQERMKHLLGIVTEDILNGVQNSLSKFNLMNDPVSEVHFLDFPTFIHLYSRLSPHLNLQNKSVKHSWAHFTP